jgi:outer membrane protein OmpA-like peptidoglycan-associated protein
MQKAFHFLILLLFISKSTWSQTDFTLYNQSYNPHIVDVNPSLLPQADFYIGLPIVSNSYAYFGNNSFTYRDLIKRKALTDSIYFDFQGFLSNIKRNPQIMANLNTDILSFGWREGRWYINGGIKEKVSFKTRISQDLLKLGVNGNTQFLGETAELGNLQLNATHYREYAFGLSRDFNCKFRIGVSLKYLHGIENIDIKTSAVNLNTANPTFDLSGNTDILVNTSGLKGFTIDSLKSWRYLFERGNRGFGVDLGGQLAVSEKFEIFASVLDLGKINWKFQPINYYNSVPEFSFKGIPLNQFFAEGGTNGIDTIKNGVQRYLDSLSNIFSIKEKYERYSTLLSSRFYLGTKYSINPQNEFRFLFLGNFFKGYLQPSISLGFTKRFNEILEFNVNWSYHNNTFQNLGAGFVFNLGLTQFVVASDNVIGLFGQYNARTINLRAGITLVSGYFDDRPNYCDNDVDGVPNKSDECPDTPGSLALNGCPDRDNDGIADKFDACPLEAGPLEMKGCPDKDHDKIIDKLDLCPDVAGKLELNGCPDRDDDGIIDDKDECPNLAGFVYLKGCPDRDRDSIPDKEDECPDFYGSKYFGGCPDSDGDSIPNKSDECPDAFGPRNLYGCPDSDNDGIIDKLDVCPDEPGLIKYRGCPFKDKDGDGVKDELDNCPTRPGPPENNGCPYADLDLDGVPDFLDKCPEIEGVKENNGCPEIKAEEQKILNTAFENLEFETGKSIIKTASFESLNELADLMVKKPQWKLLISGHTDNVGKPANNLLLSKNRALAVEKYLNQNGVNKKQLKSEWFGQTKPVANNKTPEGRQKNRRVEMTVIFE